MLVGELGMPLGELGVPLSTLVKARVGDVYSGQSKSHESACVDVADWTNGHGKTCTDYAFACADGDFKPEFRWLAGMEFHSPETACCACGRQTHGRSRPPPPPEVPTTVHGYSFHISSYCRGADREVKKPTFADCESHCASRKCACAHFGNGLCRMGYTYLGLIHSKGDFSAMVRPDAASDPGALAAQAREEATPAETCRSSLARRMPPKFYMYDGPEFLWGERLAACYHRKYGHAPWAMAKFFKNNTGYTEAGPAPQEDLSHALWLHTSLVRHRHRTKDPSAAMLYVVPAFGSLSEATGTCEGKTHTERLADAAATMKRSPWLATAAARHVVYAAADRSDLSPLGELGMLLSKAGVMAWCTSPSRCFGRFTRRVEIPMLPLLSLMYPRVHPRLVGEACPRERDGSARSGVPRRHTTVFFRGSHCDSVAAQQVRVKLADLRCMQVLTSAPSFHRYASSSPTFAT